MHGWSPPLPFKFSVAWKLGTHATLVNLAYQHTPAVLDHRTESYICCNGAREIPNRNSVKQVSVFSHSQFSTHKRVRCVRQVTRPSPFCNFYTKVSCTSACRNRLLLNSIFNIGFTFFLSYVGPQQTSLGSRKYQ